MELNKKNITKLISVIILLVVAVAIFLQKGNGGEVDVSYGNDGNSSSQGGIEANGSDTTSKGSISSGKIFIDVSGAVKEAGVVELEEGSRVFNAIDASGGLTTEAVTKYMNLAAVLEDGDKIYVPTLTEISENEEKTNTLEGDTGSDMTNQPIPSTIGGKTVNTINGDNNSSEASTSYSQDSNGSSSENLININTADSDTLQQLSGVGPATAQKIIDYRNSNGLFASVNDLTNVDGIGEKTLEKFIGQICV